MKYKVIIIGAGVSGMTASIYLKRAGISCCVIEDKMPGGQLNYISTIENYPGFTKVDGTDLALNIYNQVNNLEIPIISEKVIGLKVEENYKKVITNKQEFIAEYVIIATGRIPRKLGIEKEELLLGHGISYCAICDGPLYKDKDVVVIGGGDSAIKEALYLANICKTVTIINRREEFRSKDDLTDLKKINNINLILNNEVKSFIEEDNNLKGIILKNDEKIMTDACFIFIGYIPNTYIYKDLSITDEEGYIKTDHFCMTDINNIFAIGDVRKKEIFQLITAMNDGVVVAKKIIDIN